MSTTVPLQIQVKKPGTFIRQYEFWLQEERIAILDYPKRFTNAATISIKDNQWKIKTVGFWKTHIEITAEQSPYTKSRLDMKWTYKLSFSFDNRQVYHFKPTGFWKNVWTWFDDKNNPVIEIRSNQLSNKSRGKITLHQPASKNLYFLMMLGWFQLLTYEAHTSAGVAATV